MFKSEKSSHESFGNLLEIKKKKKKRERDTHTHIIPDLLNQNLYFNRIPS